MIEAFWVDSVKSKLPITFFNFTVMVIPGRVCIDWSDCKVSEIMIGVIKMYAYCGFFMHGIIMFNIINPPWRFIRPVFTSNTLRVRVCNFTLQTIGLGLGLGFGFGLGLFVTL